MVRMQVISHVGFSDFGLLHWTLKWCLQPCLWMFQLGSILKLNRTHNSKWCTFCKKEGQFLWTYPFL